MFGFLTVRNMQSVVDRGCELVAVWPFALQAPHVNRLCLRILPTDWDHYSNCSPNQISKLWVIYSTGCWRKSPGKQKCWTAIYLSELSCWCEYCGRRGSIWNDLCIVYQSIPGYYTEYVRHIRDILQYKRWLMPGRPQSMLSTARPVGSIVDGVYMCHSFTARKPLKGVHTRMLWERSSNAQ